MLMSRDGGNGKIDFVDITSPTYDSTKHQGITYEQVSIQAAYVNALSKKAQQVSICFLPMGSSEQNMHKRLNPTN